MIRGVPATIYSWPACQLCQSCIHGRNLNGVEDHDTEQETACMIAVEGMPGGVCESRVDSDNEDEEN